jgi:hypothetical protein
MASQLAAAETELETPSVAATTIATVQIVDEIFMEAFQNTQSLALHRHRHRHLHRKRIREDVDHEPQR